MKNPAGIKKLKDEIIESGVDLNDIPILVIDDESDSASPNVASRKRMIDNVSRTNEEIRSLLKELPQLNMLLIQQLHMPMYLLVLTMKMISFQKIL